MKTESESTGIENLGKWKEQDDFETEAEKYLNEFREKVIASGGDLGKLGIDKLSNTGNIEKLDEDELIEVLTQLSEI
jgi:hypothetical protein